jgi:hypothetical protein
MWMKVAISQRFIGIFFLFGGLAILCLQLESHARVFADDFTVDRQDDSMNSSTIRRLRAGAHKSGIAPTQTATAGEIVFKIVSYYLSTHLLTHGSKQNPHTFNVVLRI